MTRPWRELAFALALCAALILGAELTLFMLGGPMTPPEILNAVRR